MIVWATNPALGHINAFTATFSDNPDIAKAIDESSPFLLVGGGVFLIFLFFQKVLINKQTSISG